MNNIHLDSREKLHARAQEAARAQRYAELFFLVSALFPASATAQAAALFIYLDKGNFYQNIREDVKRWDEQMIERLNKIHEVLGAQVTISFELINQLLSEVEILFKSFTELGIDSIEMDKLEEEWANYQQKRAESDISRGFLETSLLFALRED
jgi:hypothetical protein